MITPPPSPDVLAHARKLAAICAGYGVTLPAAALQFPLRHQQVATVIPGIVGVAQLRDTLARLETPIPDTLWTALDRADLPLRQEASLTQRLAGKTALITAAGQGIGRASALLFAAKARP